MCANQIVPHIIWIGCVFSEYPAVFRTHEWSFEHGFQLVTMKHNYRRCGALMLFVFALAIVNVWVCARLYAKDFDSNRIRVDKASCHRTVSHMKCQAIDIYSNVAFQIRHPKIFNPSKEKKTRKNEWTKKNRSRFG